MHLSFVTPAAALIALAGVVAVLAVFAGEQRLDRLRSLLGLRRGHTQSSRLVAGAIAAVALLLTLAAAQPVSGVTPDIDLLKKKVEEEARRFAALSGVLKARQEAAMNAIRNIRD